MTTRVIVAALSLSAAGLIGIALEEGWRENAYLPTQADVPTIGFGSTKGVKQGDRITVERGLIKLREDATEAEKTIQRCAAVPMFQSEYDAWVSFVFNIGPTAFCNSTAAKLLNQHKYELACEQMPRWVMQGNNKLPGLVARREREKAMCLSAIR